MDGVVGLGSEQAADRSSANSEHLWAGGTIVFSVSRYRIGDVASLYALESSLYRVGSKPGDSVDGVPVAMTSWHTSY